MCPRAAGEEPDKAAHAGASGNESDIPSADRRSEQMLRIGRGWGRPLRRSGPTTPVKVASSRFRTDPLRLVNAGFRRLPLGGIAEGIANCSLGFITCSLPRSAGRATRVGAKLHAGTGVNTDCPYFLMR